MVRKSLVGLWAAALALSTIIVAAPHAMANNACTQARAQPIVTYERDQYGLDRAIVGVLRNCDGPKSFTLKVYCAGKGQVYSGSASSSYGGDSTIYSRVGTLPACSGRYTARMQGNYSTFWTFDYVYVWYDGGYPA